MQSDLTVDHRGRSDVCDLGIATNAPRVGVATLHAGVADARRHDRGGEKQKRVGHAHSKQTAWRHAVSQTRACHYRKHAIQTPVVQFLGRALLENRAPAQTNVAAVKANRARSQKKAVENRAAL